MTPDRDAASIAYRFIVWGRVCPFGGIRIGESVGCCRFGFPGCACMDWLMDFDERGWVDLFSGYEPEPIPDGTFEDFNE